MQATQGSRPFYGLFFDQELEPFSDELFSTRDILLETKDEYSTVNTCFYTWPSVFSSYKILKSRPLLD